LFNSLNTLTGLVEQDSKQAVRFIAELSKVYRYLLQSNEKEVIGLQQELEFTEAYFFLLQTRFGNSLSIDVQVPELLRQQYGLPPLTLQMLVENAVKHNQVSSSKPLQVRIWNEGTQWLLVQNNLQPKRHQPASSGMGLTNIATKYQLLNQPQVMVQNDAQHFVIKVPLIKSTPV
jgi:LytS/YehU family sensor histidine kinase